jgi:hypothetical protein
LRISKRGSSLVVVGGRTPGMGPRPAPRVLPAVHASHIVRAKIFSRSNPLPVSRLGVESWNLQPRTAVPFAPEMRSPNANDNFTLVEVV